MKSAIIELMDFNNDRKIGTNLESILKVLDTFRVTVVIWNLFSWLTRQYHQKHCRPMILNFESRWCNDLKMLLEKWPELNDLFMITENEFNFKHNISQSDQDIIRQFVIDKDKSIIMP